jgi:dTDP-4-dehydrorhamnose 3,5-epimerase
MGSVEIDGVLLSALGQIENPLGDVWHAMKSSDPGFESFGEAYFTHILPGKTKGWRKHLRMVQNLIVPSGLVLFGLVDERNESPTLRHTQKMVVGYGHYARLTIPPGVWVGFHGLSQKTALILNLASIEHDPGESINQPLESIPFDWTEP